jgi:hypothetical protein
MLNYRTLRENALTRLPIWAKRRILPPLYGRILDYFHAHPAEAASYAQELAVVKEIGPVMLPYEFAKRSHDPQMETGIDKKNGLPFVLHKGRPLYFPREKDTAAVRNAYAGLVAEQHPQSPHLYLSPRLEAMPFDCAIDCGAAEGIFALDVAERVPQIVLCECDEKWVEALHATFAPYRHKTTIVQKFVSDTNEGRCVTLQKLIQDTGARRAVVKVDVEGAEAKVVRGAAEEAAQVAAFLVCVYHKALDAQELEPLLRSMGFETELTPGSMLLLDEQIEKMEPPFFRKGVLRCFR